MIKISEVYNVSKAVEVGKCSKEMANRFIHRVTSGESLEEGLEKSEVDELLEKVKNINEEKLDNDIINANTSICRNDEGKIIAYKFDITRKGNIPLQGMLTTDEMQEIYRLYSLYGANITKRQINRLFPDYSYADFMRIIRAFQIFKASGPFAPHMYEEYTEEELKEMHIRLKENDFLKSVEKDEIKDLKKVNVSLAKQIIELKQQLISTESIKVDLTAMPTVPFSIVTQNRSLMLHLSDMHIGARVTSTAQFDNEWNEKELIRRLTGVLNKIDDLGQFDEIVVNMLGDSMDGMDQQTSRRDHIMPQNMDNHEQLHTYIKVMGWFFTQLKYRCNKVRMYSVPCGNHDGDFGYVANLYLAETLKQLDIPSTVYEKFMNHYEYKGHTFIICHGKDAYFMKKPFPLHLNPATEIYLRNYMDREGLDDCGKIHVIKGDLHSNALDANIKFTYRNVLSLFGDSDYSQANYPSNGYGVSYELFEGTEMISGVFENV